MAQNELIKEFEATGYIAWINADIYPDGKIYTQEYTQWLEKQVLALREAGTMPRSLTDENGAKDLLRGEFFERYEGRGYNENGEMIEFTQKVPVTWSTIKEIYAKIVSHYMKKT